MTRSPRRILTFALIVASTITATTAVYGAWSQLINPGANPHLQATQREANALPSLPVYAQATVFQGDLRLHQPSPAVLQNSVPDCSVAFLSIVVSSDFASRTVLSDARIPARAPPCS